MHACMAGFAAALSLVDGRRLFTTPTHRSRLFPSSRVSASPLRHITYPTPYPLFFENKGEKGESFIAAATDRVPAW
ncbi:hypothetical protein B0T26DRAFT_704140 [Lasiosphaeria miniovina]|uniref:Uncharacterized protein n=1 Tax=Lasiosphaeria miniovina TaxID=1954250 RepID=A0AA40AVN3_9PEZI|nr:uncharacterized protein B0T26DRAFT_704140 [Lasiosphaeria miniovina]KAK0722816.1 hypothetical protein B0T26DRAFT_704140 [Lasiosphaeria miniovina]